MIGGGGEARGDVRAPVVVRAVRRLPSGVQLLEVGVVQAADRVVAVEAVAQAAAAGDRPVQDRAEAEVDGDAVREGGLADAGLAGDEQGPAQVERRVDGVGLRLVGDVPGAAARGALPSPAAAAGRAVVRAGVPSKSRQGGCLPARAASRASGVPSPW